MNFETHKTKSSRGKEKETIKSFLGRGGKIQILNKKIDYIESQVIRPKGKSSPGATSGCYSTGRVY